MRISLWIAIALLLWSRPASADVTLRNYVSGHAIRSDQVTHHDNNGSSIDAREGNLLQVGTGSSAVFYMYGQNESTGSRLGTTSLFGGMRVYSSADLVNWTDRGFMFDPALWQTTCAPKPGTYQVHACFIPIVTYNAKNNNYVLLVYEEGDDPSVSNTVYVFTCPTPTGKDSSGAYNCTQQSNMTFPNTVAPHAPAVFVNDTGSCSPNCTAYVVATANVVGQHIFTIQLNSDYTQTTGLATDIGLIGEAAQLFQPRDQNSSWYIIYTRGGCGYCGGQAPTAWSKASSPSGSWSAPTDFSSSCGGAPRGVSQITGAAGQITWIYFGDQWAAGGSIGIANQGLGNSFMEPLSFPSGNIADLACPDTVTVPGLTLAPFPSNLSVDQSSVADLFNDNCQITSTFRRMQVLTPTTPILRVRIPLAQNNADSSCIISLDTTPVTCNPPNGDLIADLTAVNQSTNLPTGSPLETKTITGSTLPWSTENQALNFSTSVTPGTKYGIILRGTNTAGCFVVPLFLGRAASVYTGGTEVVSTNSGSTWAVETGSISNMQLMFQTFFPSVVGPGRMWLR